MSLQTVVIETSGYIELCVRRSDGRCGSVVVVLFVYFFGFCLRCRFIFSAPPNEENRSFLVCFVLFFYFVSGTAAGGL